MEEAPEREASAKIAQHLAVAVQVAEAVIRLRQQHLDVRTASSQSAAAAARADRSAQHAADRLVWSPALDHDWLAKADLSDLGRVWGAASGWADTDPTADVAARRSEARLSEVAPEDMARFDELRESGTDRVTAMRDVMASAADRNGYERRVFVADPIGTNGVRSERRITDAGNPHPADVAVDSYPRPYVWVAPRTTSSRTSTAASTSAATTRTLSR